MISEIKLMAKKKLSGNWEVAILTLFLCLVAEIVVSIFTLGTGFAVAFGPLFLGAFMVYNAIIKGEKADWKMIFDPFKERFADSFIVGVVYTIVLVGPIIGVVMIVLFVGASFLTIGLASSMGGGAGVIAGLGLMFILPAVIIVALMILMYMYAEAMYILLREKDTKGFEALKKSRLMMNGKKMKLFLFDLSFIGWWILVLIIPLVGLYAIPYCFCARLLMIESIYNESSGMDPNTVEEIVQEQEVKKETKSKKSNKTNTNKKNSSKGEKEQSSSDSGARFCKYCGAGLPEGAVFCGKCGKEQ